MNISTARFIIRYSLYLIIGLLTLSACKTKENEPINLEEVIETQEPLQRDTDIPLSLSMNLEEDQTTLRGLPLTGGAPDSPEYAPVRDWSKYDWVSDEGRPHILVAISNARNSQPTGGLHEVFKKLTKKEGKIVMKEIGGKLKPHVIIESHVTIPKGMKVDEFKVAVLVVDRAFGSLESFEQNGTISFDFSHEFYDISGQGKEFHNLVFVMEPQDIKNHMGKTGTNNRVKDIPFKLASTILVMEFADPENKGGATPYIHVDVETDGFANKGTLSMSGANNLEAYRLTAPAPLTKQIPNLFPNPTSSATAKRYARRVTIALPTKGVEQDYNIKATYKDRTGSVTDSRDYSQASKKPKNSNKYAGKMLFIDFEIDEAPLDKAKYFQTVWDSGADGRIAFFALGKYRRKSLDLDIASTHKGKIYYRKAGSNDEWTKLNIDGVKDKGDYDIKDLIEIKHLATNTRYEVWIKNLSSFATSVSQDVFGHWGSRYGAKELVTPERLLEVKNWGTSNEWGKRNPNIKNNDDDPAIIFRKGGMNQSNLLFVNAKKMIVTAQDKPMLEHVISLASLFENAESVTMVPGINEWKLPPALKYLNKTFQGAKNFNSPIGDWNVENVISMIKTFDRAEKFNQDLSKWKTGKVEFMEAMFQGAIAFNQPLNSWDVSNLEEAHYMFNGAIAFNQPLNSWDVSNLAKANCMFLRAIAFNQPLNNWDVSEVTDMGSMFEGAIAFSQPLNNWDVSKVRDMSRMFAGANRFNQDITNWNVSNVEQMAKMFYQNTVFNQPIGRWNVSKVMNMSGMFEETKVFNQDLSNWEISSVKDMSKMFQKSESFNSPLNWGRKFRKITDLSAMFSGSKAFNQTLNWNFSQCEEGIDMSMMFEESKAFNQPLNWVGLNRVINMRSMFSTAIAFNQDISDWDVSNVKNMSSMFKASKAFNQSLEAWSDKVQKVQSITDMFEAAESFNNASLADWKLLGIPNNHELGAFWNSQVLTQEYRNEILNGWKRTAEANPDKFSKWRVIRAMFRPIELGAVVPSDEEMRRMYPALVYFIDSKKWEVVR